VLCVLVFSLPFFAFFFFFFLQIQRQFMLQDIPVCMLLKVLGRFKETPNLQACSTVVAGVTP